MACYDVNKPGPETDGEANLDPRIRIELDRLNIAIEKINKLEIELDEANSTFRHLMSESTNRLKRIASSKIGKYIELARPYYDALEIAKQAQQECQKAAVKFQRANECHQEAKLTVALAEQRFMSKQNEWEFDNAWQEKLNNAIIKVTETELSKAECGREHQERATLFHAAEQKVQLLGQKLKSYISKSRPYFDEKALCDRPLANQKQRILELRKAVTEAKQEYAGAFRRLEDISEEIHFKRKMKSGSVSPCGVREPGVGAEVNDVLTSDESGASNVICNYNGYTSEHQSPDTTSALGSTSNFIVPYNSNCFSVSQKNCLDYEAELDKCDKRSLASVSATTSSAVSEIDETEWASYKEDLEVLKQRVKELESEERGSIDGEAKEGWDKELRAATQNLESLNLKSNEDLKPSK